MILISVIYLVTRLPFLRNFPVYYDSFEYSQIAKEININNLILILHQSHQPVHTFYIITIFLFKKIFFFLNPNNILILISFIFGLLTILVWFQLIKSIKNKQTALLSSIIILFFPYYFLINTNILYESELLFFQILSIYFFYKGLTKNNYFNLFLSGILWGIAQLIFIGNLFLAPIYILIFISLKKMSIYKILIFISTFLSTIILIDLSYLGSLQMVLAKYQSHILDVVTNNNNLLLLLFRIIRNILVQSSAILSLPGLVMLIISLFIILLKNNKLFIYIFITLLPVLILQQYWHAGLFGRLSVILIFPASLIIVKYLTNIRLFFLILIPVSFATISIAINQKQAPPIYLYYSLIRNVNINNLALITSDYNRFIYQQKKLNILNINGQISNKDVENYINQSLIRNKIVLIDSSALKYPYYQYDGNYYQILSVNNQGKPQIQIDSNKYKLTKYIQSSKNKEIYFMKIVYNYPYASN